MSPSSAAQNRTLPERHGVWRVGALGERPLRVCREPPDGRYVGRMA